MSLLKNTTEEQLKQLISINFSKSSVIKSLELVPSGANFRAFDILVKRYNIDTSHFTGKLHMKGKSYESKSKIPLEKVLVIDSNYNSNRLKKRLISEGIFPHCCNKCKNSMWNEVTIPLELEHKNGDHNDNRLENLEILCPNCHAQTPTYRGKNIVLRKMPT